MNEFKTVENLESLTNVLEDDNLYIKCWHKQPSPNLVTERAEDTIYYKVENLNLQKLSKEQLSELKSNIKVGYYFKKVTKE